VRPARSPRLALDGGDVALPSDVPEVVRGRGIRQDGGGEYEERQEKGAEFHGSACTRCPFVIIDYSLYYFSILFSSALYGKKRCTLTTKFTKSTEMIKERTRRNKAERMDHKEEAPALDNPAFLNYNSG